MIEHSTSNRKVLGSIPSGVEAFLFSQKNCLNIYWKFHLVLNDANSKSQVDRVDMVEFGYHGEWYTLLIIDIIDWCPSPSIVLKLEKGPFFLYLIILLYLKVFTTFRVVSREQYVDRALSFLMNKIGQALVNKYCTFHLKNIVYLSSTINPQNIYASIDI